MVCMHNAYVSCALGPLHSHTYISCIHADSNAVCATAWNAASSSSAPPYSGMSPTAWAASPS